MVIGAMLMIVLAVVRAGLGLEIIQIQVLDDWNSP
jgi:hypothetical protein